MSQERSDRFEAHVAVDGLGRERVSELVRGDVSQAGGARSEAHRPVDPGLWNRAATCDEQQSSLGLLTAVLDPLVEEGLDPRVQRYVSIGVELADRGAQPLTFADLDDGVDGEAEELALAKSGARQHLRADAVEDLGQLAGCREQCKTRIPAKTGTFALPEPVSGPKIRSLLQQRG